MDYIIHPLWNKAPLLIAPWIISTLIHSPLNSTNPTLHISFNFKTYHLTSISHSNPSIPINSPLHCQHPHALISIIILAILLSKTIVPLILDNLIILLSYNFKSIICPSLSPIMYSVITLSLLILSNGGLSFLWYSVWLLLFWL